MKTKSVPGANSGNAKEMAILPEKRREILNKLTHISKWSTIKYLNY